MTMENGEDRPLDEEATGAEDPQAWYFDLPRGAWERQEQKNRTLRERVLGNIAEDAEKAKSDPFVPRPVEPEPPARRGFLAFGRRKKQEEEPGRGDTGGSWTLNRAATGNPRPEGPDAAPEDDDWSTEVPLRTEPAPPLTLRRSSHHDEAEPRGTTDSGFAPGSHEAAHPVEHTPAAEAEADGWSGAAGGTAFGEYLEEAAATGQDEAFEEHVTPSFDPPRAADTDSGQSDEDFLAGMRSWARGDADTADPASTGSQWPPEHDVLQLRPRSEEPGERRLDWSFGPAGWSEPGEQAGETPPGEPQTDDEADMIESMRRWAERSKESDHPHFALQHHEEAAEVTPEPPPIPLRPRHHEEAWHRPEPGGNDEHEPVAPAAEIPSPPAPPPIVLRSRTAEQPAEPGRDAEAPSTRWDEFFGIERGTRPENDEDDGAGVSEGLAAMREWARKRADDEHDREIPEEFLKPFDWELDESAIQDTDVAALDREGFPAGPESDRHHMEMEDPAPGLAAHLDDAEYRPAAEHEPPLDAGGDRLRQDAGEDLLAGIFGTPPAEANGVERREKKRGGMFGRLFGRKKQEDQQTLDSAPLPAGTSLDAHNDTDIRTVQPDAGEWLADEEPDQRVAATEPAYEPFGSPAEAARDAGAPWPVAARAEDEQEGDWLEVDEPEPAALLHEFVTAFERSVPQEQGPIAGVTASSLEADEEEFAWAPEPIAFEEPVAQAATTREEEPATAFPALQLTLDAFAPGEPVVEEPPITEEPTAEVKPWWEQPTAEEEPVEAVASADAVAEEPTAEVKPWWEQPAAEEEPVEAVASADAVAEEPAAEERPWWEQPAAEQEPAEAVASADAVAEETGADEKPWWEQPVEAVASADAVAEEPVAEVKPWWEQPAAEQEPVEAVASADAVAEETGAEERPWWEQPAAEQEPVEAVASVDAVAEETAAEVKPWWEQPAAEREPAEAVASADAVAEETGADEKPWWEQPAAEQEPVEAVASVDAVAEEPVAEVKPWWEQTAAEQEPVEAVASADAVAEVPPAEVKPWWEQPAAEEQPVEAVASVDAVAEVPPAEVKPWWEQPTAEQEPAEAVASVDAVAEETVAEVKPWWEQPAAEEQPVEAVASADAVAEETVAEERPWWEQPAAEEEPVEAVASVDAVAEETVAEERPWWEQPAAEQEPVEAVASVDAVAEEPAEAPADDDPWADFVSAEPDSAAPVRFEPAATHFTPASSTWQPPTAPAEQPEEDMWGAIAAQAEEAAFAPGDSHEIDLAASLESRMAAEFDPPPAWETPGSYRENAGYDDNAAMLDPEDSEEDVILRAFERHASMPDPEETPDPEADRETREALAALFGQDASRIVEESIEEPEPQSFIRMTGLAPQRSSESFDGGWAPQQEVEEAFAHDRVTFGTDGAGFAPPPWATEEFGGEGEAAPVHHGSKTKTWIRELVETGLLALLVFLSVRASFQNFKVDGNSMYPTLEDGQFLIVNKLVYSEVDVEKLSKFIPFVDPGDDPKRNVFHGPERGDIVVLRDPRKPETDLIKRVIGLPGETVEIVGGKVYINDRLLEEPYITAPWNDTRPKILIPEGEYYVLGDNRDNSLDSRSSQVGLVPKDLIIGKAMLSYWPRDKFGLAPNEGGSLSDQKPVLTTRRLGED